MRGVLKFSAGFGSGVALAAALGAWLFVPPPHQAAAAMKKDLAECYIDNLKQVANDKAANLIVLGSGPIKGVYDSGVV